VNTDMLRLTMLTARVSSEWFSSGAKCVRQGCVLSLHLFNILADAVMREALHGYTGLQLGGQLIISGMQMMSSK